MNNGVGAVTTGTPVTISPAMTTLYTLTVTNALMQSVTRTTNVVVVAPPTIQSFTASAATIAAGSSVTLTATFAGGTARITNDVDATTSTPTSGAGVSASPGRTATYTLTVTNTAGTAVTATVTVTVVSVRISPSRSVTPPGGIVNFTASVTGAGPTVSWSADAGNITTAGVFTAPLTAGSVGVSASSMTLPAARGDAIVDVIANGLFGTAILHYLNASVQTDVPMNLAGNPVAALVPLSDGGYTRYPGVGGSDGTFGIAGVPPGPSFVTIDGVNHVLVDGGTLDFGAWRLGRTDVQPADAGTRLVLDLVNMNPWYPGGNGSDDIQLYCEGAGLTTSYFLGAGLTPASGATTLTNNLDWPGLTRTLWRSGGLIESSRGDVLYVNHYRASNGFGFSWYSKTLLETVVTTTLQMRQGAVNGLDGGFVPATMQSLSLTMPLGQYNAFANNIAPTPVFNTSGNFDVRILPNLTHGLYGEGALLSTVSLQAPSTPSTTQSVGGSFNNPFPPSWGTYVRGSYLRSYQLRQPMPGTGTQYGSGGVMHLDTGARAAMSGVAPAIQPVANPTINGVAWTSATLTGMGVTPLFAWSPPAVGAPTSYRVEVTWHDWATGQPVLVAALRVPPSVTSVRLPPGIMQTGRNYSAAIIAEQMPNSSFAARPFDTTFPTDWSRVGSGLMTP